LAHPRPTILLTGFGPFPGTDSNATAELVPEVAEAARDRFPGHEVISEVLPVEWSRGPQVLKRLLSRARAVLVLHFGVSPHARGFQIELVGRNVCGPREDASGALPPGDQVIASGPAMLASTLPAERVIARLLREGFPCSTSTNAGNYLCNSVMYHSLSTARASSTPFLSGFIHVPSSLSVGIDQEPADNDEDALTWAAAVTGTMEIIAVCLETMPHVVGA
jgi:pyroglutamyl-peptidase